MNYPRLKEKFISSIMDSSAELFSVIDASGNYQFVGGSVKHLLGYQPEELVQQSAFDYIHPDDRQLVAAALGSALFNRTTDLPNFRFRHSNGSWRWMQCRITNMADNPEIRGYITNSIDVTEKIEGEQHQLRTQAHYESLFFNHPDAVFELDRGGYFTQVNKNFPALTGYGAEEIKGVHFRELVLDKELPIAMNAFVSALEGRAHQVELSIVRSNGEQKYLSIAVVPVIMEEEIVKIQGIARDITLQKQYDLYVKSQAQQLHNIMEHVPESFFSLDREWRYTFVNKFYCNYLGYAKKQLIGKCIWELFPAAVGGNFYNTCLKVASNGTTASVDEVSPYHDGTTISVQVYPTGEDISVHFVDITEKKKEQDRLEKLSLVASNTNTCILIKNKLGHIEWANEAFERVTGYRLREIILRNPVDFLTGKETDPKMVSKLRKQLAEGKPFRGEILNYTKSGSKIWFYHEITPVFDDTGELIKYISIRTDISQRKAKEEELVRVTNDLFRQNHDLQRFSYMVSHNLRAPAANIMGLSSLLTRVEKDTPMFDELIHRIKKSAHNLDTVIRDMNHVLSIRDVDFELLKEEVHLASVLDEALTSMDYKLNRQPCQINLTVDPGIKLISNRNYLLEILKSLLSNAAKFRHSDRDLQIDIKAQIKKGAVVIQIADNGVGMNLDLIKDDIFKIYKKFHVGYQGRGIGLFLVKTYLDLLEGQIKVVSEPNKGTSFKIKFKNYVQ